MQRNRKKVCLAQHDMNGILDQPSLPQTGISIPALPYTLIVVPRSFLVSTEQLTYIEAPACLQLTGHGSVRLRRDDHFTRNSHRFFDHTVY